MRITLSALALTAGLLAAGPSVSSAQLAANGGSKQVVLNDRVNKNQFVWISEAPLENIKGSADAVSGEFTIDPKNIAATKGTVTVQVRSMKTGNSTRDNHLVSATWLDANHYPTITFRINGITDVHASGNQASGLANGDFTLHGVTRHITIPIKLTYMPESARTRERAPGDLVMVNSDFTIALKDYNVAGTQDVMGSKVGQEIKINAQLFGNTQ